MIFMFLLTMLGVVVTVGVASAAYGHFSSDNPRLKKELRTKRSQVRTAEAALRKIANNVSGMPALDAQNALEDMESAETKELN